MDTKSFSQIVAKIYDTSLSPKNWPDVLCEVAHTLGATGAMIFEVLDGEEHSRLISPYYSSNYVPEYVEQYLEKFSDYELSDHMKFAKIAGASSEIKLVNDVEALSDLSNFEKHPHIRALQEHGLYHRTGTVLNKDHWNIDRFALQYAINRGPADDEEKRAATLLLKHIAKALRIGRPLIQSYETTLLQLQNRLDLLEYGVAVITAKGEPILQNIEFERIVSQHKVFRVSSNGRIEMRKQGMVERYQQLVTSQDVHGSNGAYPRNEAILVPGDEDDMDKAVLIEIIPATNHPSLETFPAGSRLITVFDSSSKRQVDASVVGKFFPISNSEKKILELMALGHSNVEIADIRCRAIETINSQTKSLLRKTYSRNRTELVQLAMSLKTPFSTPWL